VSLLFKLGQLLVGTPLETPARSIYLRFSTSQGVQYEREIAQIMRRTIGATSNCVDIGAYRGAVLREILQLAPRGRHFAFEPVPAQFAYLRRAFAGRNVAIHQLALSDADGAAPFYHVRSRPTYSGFRKVLYPSQHEQVEEIQVQARRLDDVLPADVPIHFVKVDVEGAEYHVLGGAAATLRRWRPLVVFEHGLTSEWYYQRGSAEVYDLLREAGLEVALLRGWLQGAPPLSREQFADEVAQRRNYYFVASAPRASGDSA
jgi:FkbM family methyltransferase